MTSRSESARNLIRVNAASIDVTSSNAISFGYVSELARAGRIIAGRHRLQSPLREVSNRGAPAAVVNAHGSCLWRAEALWGAQSVLVELLDPAIADDASLTELFMSEARAARAVSSPFVSRVLDFGIESSTPYLVTELDVSAPLSPAPAGRQIERAAQAALARGEPDAAGSCDIETLAARLARRRALSFREFAQVFHDVSRGVEAMHASDVLHRDLTSERVTLLGAPGAGAAGQTAKLSFGIAKILNDTLELVRTMARRAVAPAATPRYASPEQVLGTAPPSPASDIWSLAVIAFEALTGELPFVGATTGERLVHICAAPARIPSELATLPAGFDAWFARGVEKSPTLRWRSVGDMSDALLALEAR